MPTVIYFIKPRVLRKMLIVLFVSKVVPFVYVCNTMKNVEEKLFHKRIYLNFSFVAPMLKITLCGTT